MISGERIIVVADKNGAEADDDVVPGVVWEEHSVGEAEDGGVWNGVGGPGGQEEQVVGGVEDVEEAEEWLGDGGGGGDEADGWSSPGAAAGAGDRDAEVQQSQHAAQDAAPADASRIPPRRIHVTATRLIQR